MCTDILVLKFMQCLMAAIDFINTQLYFQVISEKKIIYIIYNNIYIIIYDIIILYIISYIINKRKKCFLKPS